MHSPLDPETHVKPVGERELVVTRDFAAPRELVFDAWTSPALLRQWLGVQNGWSLDVCEVDLRVGGRYRFGWAGPDGITMGVAGTYHKLERPACIVTDERFDEPWYPGECLITNTLTELEGGTRCTLTLHYDSLEARDMVLAGPATEGLGANYDVLAELLAQLDG